MAHPSTKPNAALLKQVDRLRKVALAYPETREDFPWGHSAFKVKGKAFVFLHADGEGLSLSVKLPESNALALELPFSEPTGYGLGKSGWVTARFRKASDMPLDILRAWIEESFRAVAPKRLSAAASNQPAKKSAKAARKAVGKSGSTSGTKLPKRPAKRPAKKSAGQRKTATKRP